MKSMEPVLSEYDYYLIQNCAASRDSIACRERYYWFWIWEQHGGLIISILVGLLIAILMRREIVNAFVWTVGNGIKLKRRTSAGIANGIADVKSRIDEKANE